MRNKEVQELYPVIWKVGDSSCVLLWEESDAESDDHFISLNNGRLAVGRTSSDFPKPFANPRKARIHWNSLVIFAVDEFFKKLNSIKAGQSITPEQCNYFLDAWNLMGDLAYTLKAPKHLQLKSIEGPSWQLYNRLFLNVIPVSGLSGKSGSRAKWRKEEIDAFSTAMRDVWKFIAHTAPEIIGKSAKNI